MINLSYTSSIGNLFLITLIFTSFGCLNNPRKSDHVLKSEIGNTKAKFFKDFDIFTRQGINEIMGDTLYVPFFEYFRTSDTTFQLNLHRNDEYGLRVEKMVVPLGEQIVYTFHNINDGPRHYYAKIVGDTIIRFNYREIKPDDFNAISDDSVMYYEIIPDEIEYIYHDTCFLYWPECYFHKDVRKSRDVLDIEEKEDVGINTRIINSEIDRYAIFPFQFNINRNCENYRLYYFDKNGVLWHYENNLDPKEKMGKNKPVSGLYGYKKEFKYWNDLYNLGRMN